MRLINADKLKRKAQKVATESWKMKLTAKIETTLNQFIDWIDEAETIDAVPVTRCKECKNWDHSWKSTSPDHHYCPFIDWPTSESFYCAKAERRTS